MGCGESKHQVVDGNTITRKKSSIVSRWYSRGRETHQETSTKSGSDKNKGESNKNGDEDVKNANGVVSGGEVKNDSDKVADVKEQSEKKQVVGGDEAKFNVVQEKEECIPLKKQDEEPALVACNGNDDGKVCSVDEKVKENVESAEDEKKKVDEERKEESLVKETEAIKPIESGGLGENVVSMIKETEVAEKPVEPKRVEEAKPIKTEDALNVKDTVEEPVKVKEDSLVKETEEEAVNVNEETHVKEAEPAKAVAAVAEELANAKETEKVQAVEPVSSELQDNLIKETKTQASTTPSKEEDLSEKKEKSADSTTEEVLTA